MDVGRSSTFKGPGPVHFTYESRSHLKTHCSKPLSQSIFVLQNQENIPPRQELSFAQNRKRGSRRSRVMAESFNQENCSQIMNASYYPIEKTEIHSEYSGLGMLSQLEVKEVAGENYICSIEDFEIGELLGKGAMGNVYCCRHIETGFFCAIKKIRKSSVRDVAQFVHSVKVHMFCSQPNIVQLYAIFDDCQFIYQLMELCLDGNLKGTRSNLKTPKEIKKTALGIAYGLRHLHRRGIRHGDIKLENIITCHGMPKIADFDTICCTQNSKFNVKQKRSKFCGSPLYFSPEMLRESIFGTHDDVWSLGVLLYELVCGYAPFEIRTGKDLFQIINREIKPFPKNTDSELQSLVIAMLSKRLCDRPKLPTVIRELQKS